MIHLAEMPLSVLFVSGCWIIVSFPQPQIIGIITSKMGYFCRIQYNLAGGLFVDALYIEHGMIDNVIIFKFRLGAIQYLGPSSSLSHFAIDSHQIHLEPDIVVDNCIKFLYSLEKSLFK